MKRTFTIAFMAAIFLLYPLHALAGSFKVKPIRIYLNARTKTAVLRVKNTSDLKVAIQLEAMEWSQDETGVDAYEKTKDIIFFPKMVTLEKDEERIIRIGYQGKPGPRELTYRLYLQELPVTTPGEETALKFALRLGLPIFIKPLKEVQKSAIEEVELKEGRLLTKVKNSGNTHFMVARIKAEGLDKSGAEVFSLESGGWYVLQGASRIFSMDIPQEDCLKANAIKVAVEVKETNLDARLDVDAAQCQKPEEPDKQEIER